MNVTKLTHKTQLVNRNRGQAEAVVKVCNEEGQVVPREHRKSLVNGKRDAAKGDDPGVELPIGQVGHLFMFLMHWNRAVIEDLVNVEDLVKPVVESPLVRVRSAPGGLERVWVVLDIHCVKCCTKQRLDKRLYLGFSGRLHVVIPPCYCLKRGYCLVPCQGRAQVAETCEVYGVLYGVILPIIVLRKVPKPLLAPPGHMAL